MFPIFPTKPNILKISIFPSSCSGSILHYSMASWLIMGSYIALHRPACSDVCVALQGICPAGGRKPEVPWWHMAQIANIGLSDLSIGQRTQDKVGQLKFSSSLSLSVMTRNHHTSCGAFQCRESLSLWLLHPFMDLTELWVELVSEYSMLWRVALPLGFLDFAALSSKTLVSSRGDLLQNKGPNNHAQKKSWNEQIWSSSFQETFLAQATCPDGSVEPKKHFPTKVPEPKFHPFHRFHDPGSAWSGLLSSLNARGGEVNSASVHARHPYLERHQVKECAEGLLPPFNLRSSQS